MNNPIRDVKKSVNDSIFSKRTTRDTSYWHGMPVMYMGTYYPNKLFRNFSDSNAPVIGFRVVRSK